MNHLYRFFLFFLVIPSCGHHQKNGELANHHMHQKSHVELIKSFDNSERDKWQKPQLVLKLLGELKRKSIIDIGSGSGYFTRFFLRSGAFVTAADVDRKFLNHIRDSYLGQYPSLKLSLIDYDDPKMDNSSFDIAFTANTYHHISDRRDYLKKVLKGLKVGGMIVIIDFKKYQKTNFVFGPPIEMRVDLPVVVEELVSSGFDKIRVINEEFEYQYFVSAERVQ